MSIVTADYVREMLDYDAETGEFRWKAWPGSRRVKVGETAGCLCPLGYRVIRLRRRGYKAHRLAWLYVHGEWPSALIDHRDGNPRNNAIGNLRVADKSINSQNVRRSRANSKTGLLGVSPSKMGRFIAQITINGRKHHLGRHSTAEAAHATYMLAKRELHPGSAL